MARGLKDKIRERLVSRDSSIFDKETVTEDEFKKLIKRTVEEVVSSERISLSEQEKKDLINELLDEFIGFGPIEHFLKDPQITEIMINGADKIYIERQGRKELTNVTFDSEQHLMQIIHKLLAPTRRRVDESYPYTEISLKDGSRANIIIPPLALDGPTVTLRKFSKELKTVDDLINLGTMDRRIADLLLACLRAKMNIIFSGASGAGKTTTLNVLSSYIVDDERIITIEDTAELRLSQEHVVRLEARQPNIEGKGEVSIRDLFKNSLRMRPDRIILGEIRSAEALDMLQAICSGHTGSLSVLHANTPQDVVYRLETMILTSGVPIGIEAIHRQIAAAINIIVQQQQLVDGSRKITYITQVNGLKDGQAVLENIFVYEIEGIDSQGKVSGAWKATGVIPEFFPVFRKAGINLPQEIFNKG